MTDRDPVKMILDHMGITPDFRITTSVHMVRIDDGADTYIVTVMQFQSEPFPGGYIKTSHTLTRYVMHEVDDLWTYKLLDEHTFTDNDLFDGTFDYMDDENKEAGHIVFDYANDNEPTIIKDATYRPA